MQDLCDDGEAATGRVGGHLVREVKGSSVRRFAWVLAMAAVACGSSDSANSASKAKVSAPCTAANPNACRQPCIDGDEDTCDVMIHSLLSQFSDNGQRQAAEVLEELCKQGRGRHCVDLGMALAGGLGVPADRERAVELFEAHCGADADGCSQYGAMFVGGVGVAVDLGLARLLLGEACDHNDKRACTDFELVLESTCQSGHGPSCNELGARRANEGRMDEAVPLFSRACELEDADGCSNRDQASAG